MKHYTMYAGSDGGEFNTHSLRFEGDRLYVNTDARRGCLKVEILDEKGIPINGFEKSKSVAIIEDGLKQEVGWKGSPALTKLKKRPVRFRFYLRNARLFSFRTSNR